MKRKLTPITDPANSKTAHPKAVASDTNNPEINILQFTAVSAARHLKISQILANWSQKSPP
ncbi:hypothetical protein HQ865_00790 [Mucilaginibacter mali]|uniref:Uncharacterized protein n=1 Tax=Mucilaginibacter mali TaxID=2740462 RepID=A0A7D4TSJ4_9SPHI|nr:hypothetical protein [Mucilaginibacter mali]QKJ28355.1 hypothetical protein HQ865_00790 [Mucilaginibacter mali]